MTEARDRALRAAFGLAALVAVGVVAIPIALIRPFSPQTPATVAVAYQLRSVSPWLAPAAAALAAFLAIPLLLRRPRRLATTLVALSTLLAAGAAWMSRQNHFEWMFAPLKRAEYAKVRDATFVDPADMVIAVEMNGDAVAYPIRQMGYHHVVNDEVGGIPVVATY